jgi:hypothetical protein
MPASRLPDLRELVRENRTMDENLPPAPDAVPTLGPEDYYMEGSNLVFTAAYHLKRGYCCDSGCRHCPYRDPKTDDIKAADVG